MNSVIFNFNGRSYIAGMYWSVLDSSLISRLRQYASRHFGLKFGLMIPMNNGKSLLGLVEQSDAIEAQGAYSVALELMRIIKTNNWSGVFYVTANQYVYLAVRNGMLTSNSDVISQDLGELKRMVDDDIKHWKPATIFMPDGLIPGAKSISLMEAFFEDFSDNSLVKNISKDWVYKLFGSLIFLLMLVIGYNLYQKYEVDKHNENVVSAAAEESATINLLKSMHKRSGK